MGFRDLLAGSAPRVRRVSLKQGESELCREVAAVGSGTLSSVGGDLVLTDRRLIFCPQESKDRVEVLTWGLPKAAAPDPDPGLPGRFGELVQQHDGGAGPGVRTVASVSADGGGWLKPPTLVVLATDGGATEIGILAGRRSSNRDRNNVVARDRMLAAIHQVLAP